jgi:hypothetical protein
MKYYIVKLINGDSTRITEEEYKKLAGKTGLVFVPSSGETINLASVSHILPEEGGENREKQKLGMLHDGTCVIKQFGEWVDADSPIDERGLRTVRLDSHYYPEVTRDCVPTPEEFEREYKALPPSERLEKMLGSSPAAPRLQSGFVPMALLAPEAGKEMLMQD